MKKLSKWILGSFLFFICANSIFAQNEITGNSKKISELLNAPDAETTKITSSNPTLNAQFGTSLASDGNNLVVGVPGERDSSNVVRGAAYIFTKSGSNWIQQARLIPPVTALNPNFGISVAISGERIIVGASSDSLDGTNNRQGAGYVFVRQNDGWILEQRLSASDATSPARFGESVAISGNTIVIGDPGARVENVATGAAYVYAESGGLWTQQTKLIDVLGNSNDSFGSSVDIDNGTIAVGATFGDVIGQTFTSGIVCIFTGSGSNWIQQARIYPSEVTGSTTFGISLDLEGDTLIVGARELRAVYVFVRSANVWTQQQKLTTSSGLTGFAFGSSVSLSGNTLLAGSSGEAIGGAAYVFVRKAGLWTRQARLTPSDGGAGDSFGFAVSVKDGNLLVGSPSNNSSLNNTGAVYYFVSPLPAPDLQNGSDSGISNTDNITNLRNLSFDIGNVTSGATIELLRNGSVVDSKTAAEGMNTLVDSSVPNEQGNYSYSTRQIINGITGSTSEITVITIDTEPPIVAVNQHPFQADPTPNGGATFTIEFSEPVFGFSESDVSFAGSTANLEGVVFYLDTQPNPLLFYLRVNNVIGNNQTIVASLMAGSVSDTAGNLSQNSITNDNTVTIDNVRPTVTINQALNQIDPTAGLPLNFTVIFSEPVTDFDDTTDITFNGSTANTSAATVNITGSGTTYNVAIGNITSNGQMVRVGVQPNAAADALGNLNTFSTSTDNIVTVDNVRPTVTINQATNQADPTTVQPVNFRVVFSEAVEGFTGADISFAGSTANVSTANIVVTGSGTTYNVAVNNITSSGLVRAAIVANAAQDALGNLSSASTSTDNIVIFNLQRGLFDFDGDGKSDISTFRPDNGAWYLNQSSAGFTGVTFGFGTDKLAPADYDGDGKTDVAVYRGGTWYLNRSTQGFYGVAFGDSNDIPVPADYDGDGRADIAVFRPSNGTWYVQGSTSGFYGVQFGQTGDKPVPADYDGDGKADIAVNRSGTWYIQRSQLGFYGIQFGDSNDKLVPADYDGDGKADVAVFRPSNGTWYLQQSTNGFTGIAFGLGTDTPVAADYDGDGRADVAVYRNGTWYLNRSTQGFFGVAFGASTDQPLPNVFVR